jgi:hypothetical protein
MAAPDWTEFTARRTFLRSWRLARVGALWDRQTRWRRSTMLAIWPSISKALPSLNQGPAIPQLSTGSGLLIAFQNHQNSNPRCRVLMAVRIVLSFDRA